METYLSVASIAQYFGVAEKTVIKWVLNREIPFHKIKKIVRFRLSEIELWVNTNGKFPAVDEDAIPDAEFLKFALNPSIETEPEQ